MPPSVRELEKRLLRRGTDDPSLIRTRVSKAAQEIKLADEFDNIVINDNLEVAEKEVYDLVKGFLDKKINRPV